MRYAWFAFLPFPGAVAILPLVCAIEGILNAARWARSVLRRQP